MTRTSKSQSDVVEVERLAAEFGPLALEVLGIVDHQIRSDQRDHADGDVDQEDVAPVVVDAEPAAERGADDRAEDGGDAEQRHGRALLLFGEGVEQDALAAWLEPATGESLDDAEQNHLRETGREAAQRRGQREDGNADQEVIAAAEACRQPAGDRQDNGVGGQVAGDDPLGVALSGRQASGNVPQGHVRDRGVQDLHERGHDDHDGDDPGVDRSWSNDAAA